MLYNHFLKQKIDQNINGYNYTVKLNYIWHSKESILLVTASGKLHKVLEETAAAKKQEVSTEKRWVEDKCSTPLKTEKQSSSEFPP